MRGRTDVKQHTAWAGNNLKAMHLSVEGSLKKLRTSYIDILYVHFWDWGTRHVNDYLAPVVILMGFTNLASRKL